MHWEVRKLFKNVTYSFMLKTLMLLVTLNVYGYFYYYYYCCCCCLLPWYCKQKIRKYNFGQDNSLWLSDWRISKVPSPPWGLYTCMSIPWPQGQHEPRVLVNVAQHNIINLPKILAAHLFIILEHLVCTNLCVKFVDDSMVLKCTKLGCVYVKKTRWTMHSMMVWLQTP